MDSRVLVLGDDTRAALSVVRSLGRKGLRVDAGIQKADSFVQLSRYVNSTIHFPSLELGTEPWLKRLSQVLSDSKYDLVIPTCDDTMVPIVRHRSDFSALARLAIPDERGFEYTYNKVKTFELARELQVPCPRMIAVPKAAELNAVGEVADLEFPVVIKPCSSKVLIRGRLAALKVAFARNVEELESKAILLPSDLPFLVQEFFQGIGVGQEFLVKDGRVLRAFQHERIHEPIGGGGSSYRKSVRLHDGMLESSKRLLEGLSWTGVAMVEYRYNHASDQFTLMEINGRFWGSLPLALAAGADFPWDLYQLIVNGIEPDNTTYRIGVRSRNISVDRYWFRKNWTADRTNPTITTISRSQSLLDMARILLPTEHLDAITRDDPKPGVSAVSREMGKLFGRLRELMSEQMERRRAKNPAWVRGNGQRLKTLLAKSPRIVFICKGNVCRSPFAACYASKRLNGHFDSPIQIESAGTISQNGRSAAPHARSVAAEFDVDLASHRSQLLDSQSVAAAGAIVCMDRSNYMQVGRMFPDAKDKLFYLAPFDPNSSQLEIEDPIGGTRETFQDCYSKIAAAVDSMLEVIRPK